MTNWFIQLLMAYKIELKGAKTNKTQISKSNFGQHYKWSAWGIQYCEQTLGSV